MNTFIQQVFYCTPYLPSHATIENRHNMKVRNKGLSVNDKTQNVGLLQGYIQIHTDIKYVPGTRVSTKREHYPLFSDDFECKIKDKNDWANAVADNIIEFFSNEIN